MLAKQVGKESDTEIIRKSLDDIKDINGNKIDIYNGEREDMGRRVQEVIRDKSDKVSKTIASVDVPKQSITDALRSSRKLLISEIKTTKGLSASEKESAVNVVKSHMTAIRKDVRKDGLIAVHDTKKAFDVKLSDKAYRLDANNSLKASIEKKISSKLKGIVEDLVPEGNIKEANQELSGLLKAKSRLSQADKQPAGLSLPGKGALLFGNTGVGLGLAALDRVQKSTKLRNLVVQGFSNVEKSVDKLPKTLKAYAFEKIPKSGVKKVTKAGVNQATEDEDNGDSKTASIKDRDYFNE